MIKTSATPMITMKMMMMMMIIKILMMRRIMLRLEALQTYVYSFPTLLTFSKRLEKMLRELSFIPSEQVYKHHSVNPVFHSK